jgi:nucleotide-binding universal stress UspA family protein
MPGSSATPDPAPPATETSHAADAGKQRSHVLCGTDFTAGGSAAAEVAAEMAHRLGEPLDLIHAVNEPSRDALAEELRQSLALYARKQLYDERERLNATGAEVIERFRAGPPHEVVLEAAHAPGAQLLVLAAGRRMPPLRKMLGNVAERVAESAPIPTLVVRDAGPLLEWLRGGRTLRIFVAADLTPPSEAAIHWAIWLRGLGRCALTIAHIDNEPIEPLLIYRYGSASLMAMGDQVRRTEARCFRQFVRELVSDEPARIRVATGWGRSDAHLIDLAARERADLIVTGTHQRHGLRRIVHHSVSRGLLHYAPMNVACIPSPALH